MGRPSSDELGVIVVLLFRGAAIRPCNTSGAQSMHTCALPVITSARATVVEPLPTGYTSASLESQTAGLSSLVGSGVKSNQVIGTGITFVIKATPVRILLLSKSNS